MDDKIYFGNFGGLKTSIPADVAQALLDESDYIQNNFDKSISWNSKLVGHIQREYLLQESKNILEEYVINLSNTYDEYFGYFKNFNILTKKLPMTVGETWINFQKKHEFNPVHNHTGILSFVIWLKIPYNLEDERRLFDIKTAEANKTSLFEFLYVSPLGKIIPHPVPVDKSYENTIVLFPSEMMHCVYPFYTSDEYRISVSGNLYFKVD